MISFILHDANNFGEFGDEGVFEVLCDFVPSESEVRLFGDCVSRVSGKGKGSGQIGGLGVGGISGMEVNAARTLRDLGIGGGSGTEVDGSGGLGVGGYGVGGDMGTFGGQFCVPEVGERTFI